MKLEVGMYVRFKDKKGNQYIRRITSVNSEYPDKLYAGIYIDKKANNCNKVSLKNIIKASDDVLDLIKKGDYVNGKKVIDKWEEPDWYGYFIKLDGETEIPTIRVIQSIVTKEQFENKKYEVIKND